MPNATPWVWRYSNCFYWTQISFLSMRIRPSISWVGPGYNYTESSSSHQCVCILSCHLVCSNYFYLQQQFILFAEIIFYLQQLYWICCNFILFAATLFYLLQPYFISSNFILFSATLFNLQQLFYLRKHRSHREKITAECGNVDLNFILPAAARYWTGLAWL